MQISVTINFKNSTKRSKGSLLIKESEDKQKKLYLEVPDDGMKPYPIKIVHASAPLAGTNPRLTIEDGNILHLLTDTIPDALIDHLPASMSRWQALHRFEQVGLKGMFVVMLLIVGILYGFRLSIEPIADFATKFIPPEYEQAIGKTTLSQLDLFLFKTSTLESDSKQRIEEIFINLKALDPDKTVSTQLVFRSSPAIGPNAFALPGNIIVLLDEMVEFADDEDLIAAIMAHELAHVTKRHAMRYITRSSLLAVAAAIIFGADDSLIEEFASMGSGLALAKYSRKFELEADQQGAEYMQRLGLDAYKISKLFDMIEAECEGACDGGGFFTSHPSFAERRSNLSNLE